MKILKKFDTESIEAPPLPLRINCTALQSGVFSVDCKQRKVTKSPEKKITRMINTGTDTEFKYINIETIASRGMPNIVDQTLYFAFQKFLQEEYRYLQSSEDRIYFDQRDILRRAGIVIGGSQAERLKTWGRRMKSTEISFYRDEARTESKAEGHFNIFQEFVTINSKLPNGEIAQANWVRMSKWEFDNWFDRTIPLDFNAYLQLKNPVAQGLMPHLQVGLFAAKNSKFQKNYEEMCQLLGLTPVKNTHLKKANDQFAAAISALKAASFIKDGGIIANDRGILNFVAVPGKLFEEKKLHIVPAPSDSVSSSKIVLPEMTERQKEIIEMLVGKEIAASHAATIALAREADEIVAIVKHCEILFATAPEKYHSPGGYLFTLLKDEEFTAPAAPGNDQSRSVWELPGGDQHGAEFTEELAGIKEKWQKIEFNDFCFQSAAPGQNEKAIFATGFEAGAKIWQRVLAAVKTKINEQIFDSWFSIVKFAGFDEQSGVMTLCTSELTIDWITNYYGKVIPDALKTLEPTYGIKWISDEYSPTETTPEDFYRQQTAEHYRTRTGLTFEQFLSDRKDELDTKFAAYLDNNLP